MIGDKHQYFIGIDIGGIIYPARLIRGLDNDVLVFPRQPCIFAALLRGKKGTCEDNSKKNPKVIFIILHDGPLLGEV